MASDRLRKQYPWVSFRCDGDGCYTCCSQAESVHETLLAVREALSAIEHWYEIDDKAEIIDRQEILALFRAGGRFAVEGEEGE